MCIVYMMKYIDLVSSWASEDMGCDSFLICYIDDQNYFSFRDKSFHYVEMLHEYKYNDIIIY